MSQSNNYYQTQGQGGGGYIQGSPSGSLGTPGGTRNNDDSHSLRPVTVGQLLRAKQAHTDAEWTIEDVQINHVTVVGQAVSIQKQTTNSVYTIDDGSGRIEARFWADTGSEEDGENGGPWGVIEENAYVRVTGILKTFGNKRYINALHIRAAKDPHELYFHLLEAMTVNLIFERGPPPGPGQEQTQQEHGQQSNNVTSAYTAPTHTTSTVDEYAHLPAIERSIVNFIMNYTPQDDDGVHVKFIAISLKNVADATSISAALDRLMDDGYVFSTIDESHFKLSR